MKRAPKKSVIRWGVVWINGPESIDGANQHLCGDFPYPTHCFVTRWQARQFVKEKWGYIAARPDLRAAPHGWRVPRVVKVKITAEVVQ